MKSVIHVINRCLVIEFYKQNAAFFGLIFLVLFGFIKSSEHILIGTFLVADPFTLFYIFALYSAYLAKVILFVLPTVHKKENRFLESFLLFPFRVKVMATLLISAFLLLPIAVYSAFLIFIAGSHGYIFSILLLLFGMVIFTVSLAYFLFSKLNKLPVEKAVRKIRFVGIRPKPHFLFFVEHIFRNDIVLFLLTKFYVCAVIIGAALLYKTDDFDLRVLTVGVLLAFVGNVAIIHKYVWFQHHKMAFAKNLPISRIKLFAQKLATFTVLLSPEIIVTLRYYPLTPTIADVSGVLFFGLALVALLYGLLLIRQYELSDFMTVLFWLVVFTTFLILFSVHPLLLGIVYLVLSAWITNIRCYLFEYVDD